MMKTYYGHYGKAKQNRIFLNMQAVKLMLHWAELLQNFMGPQFCFYIRA